ncbi:MAG: ATP-binding protein, partial [Scytonema sp. PMC 1069.18]|nr:ATP-binding protein [Scytonema sp. PMC 1069.18]
MVKIVTGEAKASGANNFISGGGEMGATIRAFDWSQTPLGTIETWSSSLRTATSICLNSRFPMVIWWGKELVLLYNDAWKPILGSKHPQALGKPGREVWEEIWDIIGRQLEGVLTTGEATWSDDFLLPVDRHGYIEEAYFTYSYSPIFLETGEVGGAFTAVTETTRRVLGERRVATLRDLAAQAALAKTVKKACLMAIQTLADNPKDIPFALLYQVDADGRQAFLCSSTLEPELPASPRYVDLTSQSESGWLLGNVMELRQSVLIDDLCDRFGHLPSGFWSLPPRQALVLPIVTVGQEKPVGMLVVGVNPGCDLDEDYRNFFDMVVGHIGTAIANANAYEEERKRVEALAELDQAKTTFFSNVSHEFRTPLSLILSPVEDALADTEVPLTPPHRERLEMARRNGLRLLKLVNTLLDFSRIEAGRIQAVYELTDLASFTIDLASVFRSTIEKAGLHFLVDCPPLQEDIYIDREMWEKIVLNLLSNAFKFTFEGEIAVHLRHRDDHVELAVQDTGIGIPSEEVPHLFKRFHRVKGSRGRTFEGSGIGLSLVQELVHLHGGVIHVTSTLGAGTCFTVSIPTGASHLPQDRISAICTQAGTATGTTPYV